MTDKIRVGNIEVPKKVIREINFESVPRKAEDSQNFLEEHELVVLGTNHKTERYKVMLSGGWTMSEEKMTVGVKKRYYHNDVHKFTSYEGTPMGEHLVPASALDISD